MFVYLKINDKKNLFMCLLRRILINNFKEILLFTHDKKNLSAKVITLLVSKHHKNRIK